MITLAEPELLPVSRETYVLRPYQQQAVDAGVFFLESKEKINGIEVLPTGSGKSLVIANIVKRLDAPCLIFQPSKEILEQNFAKFQSYGFEPSIYSASCGKKNVGDITLATIGSVKTKAELFSHVKYIIVDECHLGDPKQGMMKSFLEMMQGVKVLGLTATPYRLYSRGFGTSILKFLTRTRPRIYTKLVYYVQNGDLFTEGYLTKLFYKQVETGFDKARLRLNSTGSDYTDESVKRHFEELHFSDQIAKAVLRVQEIGRTGTLVFTRFCEEAEYIAGRIQGAELVTAKTKKAERERIIRGFKSGEIPVVSNVGVLGIGFDFPALANVILARPTMSLSVYYQQVGRCVRTAPGKRNALIVDMVKLMEQFGRVEELTIDSGNHETWYIRNRSQQLTNIEYSRRQQ
jgi:DNA repair protein RadD